jgi:hypothetical protein
LREIESFALRYAVDDVEENNFAELPNAGKVSECAADLASTDQCNFVTRHDFTLPTCAVLASAPSLFNRFDHVG